jgi:erythromycin esterase-like protein
VRIRSIDPGDGDFADLEPLRATLKGVRVGLLGEQSHGHGATFLAKGGLKRFLHERMGFDVLAFESGLYDCAKAWDLLAGGEAPRKAAARGIFRIWTASREVQPGIDYLGSCAKSGAPLDEQWRSAIAACEPSGATRAWSDPFWRQFLTSLRVFAEETWRSNFSNLAGDFTMRDRQMGERYPNRMIIVWAATFHNARRLGTIDTGDPKLARLYGGAKAAPGSAPPSSPSSSDTGKCAATGPASSTASSFSAPCSGAGSRMAAGASSWKSTTSESSSATTRTFASGR